MAQENKRDYCSKLHAFLQSTCLGFHLNPLVRHPELSATTKVTIVVARSSIKSGPSKSSTIQLYSKTQIDPTTGKGKLSEETSFKNGKSTKHGESNTITYHVLLHIEPEFGVPGAIVVKNGDQNEFFLKFVTVEGEDGGSIYFNCNSWVYPVKKTSVDRLFFSNTSYLPSETPEALRSLRQEELASLRGNGRGERKAWDRIYDYDRYNDLGAPDKGEDHVRPVLGGSRAYPYPRRGRTGRPLSIDRMTETRHKLINLDFYVPPDERFSPSKLSEFITNSLQAILHFVIPEVKSLFQGDHGNFESFEQVTKDLYAGKRSYILEGKVMDKLKSFLPEELFKEVLRMTKGNPVKFPVPQVIAADEYAWKTDEEFAREMLAGLNPVMIKRLETFPPIGKGGKRSSITILDIRKSIGRVTVQQLMNQRRIFILDHHDYLMPYLKRINEQKDVCVYASRTLLLLKLDGSLKPLAIELSLPGEEEGEEINRVFLPATEGTDAALWQLAKAHVAVNDSGYHQLITHWLHTHAAVEPFVIATRRQLSAMHPIHKLLHPHFKDTMHINSLARSILLNSGGILEMTMFPGKFSMELSSKIYENWRFDEQGLPADLLKRGLAVKTEQEPSSIRLRITRLSLRRRCLDIWSAITTYISSYCSLFYPSDASVVSDVELQSWWTEIRQVGHGDSPASSWPNLDSLQNLTTSLTTIVWIASALHASVNFGQYAYAGFLPNRPTKCRRFIPAEGTPEFAEFLKDPDRFFLRMLTDRFTATLGIALIEVLSRHTGDEVYLGRRDDGEWTNDEEVKRVFLEFGEELRRVEKKIEERNSNMLLKNRRGLVNVPYMLMYPDTANVGGEKGLTGRGIPNSVSI
ncbi:uncharacterized protein A4U43_C09F4760 [Asparagus officinalis]|uniref:Lipoxygenase n=1 Tax=Asparagus officinalis TaxID=4686 RepID=A0A5P1E755_ASPOF|nr:linoleate 9S-lipoxygenase 6-like [Asparagus officinalis]ONK57843.1 uncharacterized protein A4U43_C09F4760 [Asparagus officinalis]